MKKLITFLIAALMLVTAAGCNSSRNDTSISAEREQSDTKREEKKEKKKAEEKEIEKVELITAENPKELLPKKDDTLTNLAKGRWNPTVFIDKNTFIAEDEEKGDFIVDAKGNINEAIGRHPIIYRVSGNIIECCKENGRSDFYNVADNTKYLEDVVDADWEIQKGYIEFTYTNANGTKVTQKRDMVDFSILNGDVGEEYVYIDPYEAEHERPENLKDRRIKNALGSNGNLGIWGYLVENDDGTLSVYDKEGNLTSLVNLPAEYEERDSSEDGYAYFVGPGEFDESYYFDVNSDKVLRVFNGEAAIMYTSKYYGDFQTPMNIVSMYNKSGYNALFSKDLTHFISGYQISDLIDYHDVPTPEPLTEIILERRVPNDEGRDIREYVWLDLENWTAEVLCKVESTYDFGKW